MIFEFSAKRVAMGTTIQKGKQERMEPFSYEVAVEDGSVLEVETEAP